MKKTFFCLFFLSITFVNGLVHAQPAQADAGDVESANVAAEVNVVGVRDPEWKSYAALLKGVEAFEKKHGMAPAAELRFMIRSLDLNTPVSGISLRLVSDTTSTVIPISDEGIFRLERDAAALEDKSELVLNKKKATVRWRPYVVSPNLPNNVRRLGDLRLECEVRWAAEKDDMSFIQRNTFRLAGGPCASSLVKTHFLAPKLLASATLVHGDTRAALSVANGGASFIPPLSDASLPDEALIEFTYLQPGAGK